jgi:DNA-binding beta-propeller fold protein YncE
MLAVLILSALAAESIALPGGPPVRMDYLTADLAHGRIWVPAGNTGNVDVVDIGTGKVTPIGGFPTGSYRRPGGLGVVQTGPSSAAVGDGVVWIGNRGDQSVCGFDARTLARGACRKLPSMPDGVAYVAATHEVWVTTPRNRTVTILPVSKPEPGEPSSIKIDGDPEGLAVDQTRGLFYTNLEDHDRTLAIDAKTRQVVASFPTGCGQAGPRGLALDAERRLLFAACTNGAVVLDLAHDGKQVGRLETGLGVDNIDYAAKPGLLLVAAGGDATLTFARVGKSGALTKVSSAATAKGARCVVAGADGTGYAADSAGGRLIVVRPPK